MAQLDRSQMIWNVVDLYGDENFDSSTSLTESLWGVLKHQISNLLAHLLLVSDVWRVSDEPSAKLWCDFVKANYGDRLMSPSSSDSPLQMPIGFRVCIQPFGRLLASLDVHFAKQTDSSLNRPLCWLLNYIARNQDENSQIVKQVITV